MRCDDVAVGVGWSCDSLALSPKHINPKRLQFLKYVLWRRSILVVGQHGHDQLVNPQLSA